MIKYFSEIIKGIISLIEGLGVTFKHFFHPSITIQYPEEKPYLPTRFRGRLAMPVDPEKGSHRCTGCGICVKACPNGSLKTEKMIVDGKPKPIAATYEYNMSTCIYCNLCVESCPFSAIIMSDDYENAVYDRKDLIVDLVEEKYEIKGSKAKWFLSKFKEEE